MPLILVIGLFCAGIALIVKGGDVFVDAAGWIAEVSGIPKFLVGATIVSLATTLPEMIVSLFAAAEGKVDMAIGNALGSVTANTGIILSIAILFMTVTALRKDFLIKALIMLLAALTLPLASFSGSLKIWGCLFLVIYFIVFVVENIAGARAGSSQEDRPPFTRKELIKNVACFLLGAAGIVIGSRLLVSNGSLLAAYLGVPERIIAITLVAIGTSLPELVTAITSIVKKQASLSVGNIIGANIIDLTLILPLCSLVSGKALPISQQVLWLDMPACLLIALVALLPMLWREKFFKWQGICMLIMYAGYIIVSL